TPPVTPQVTPQVIECLSALVKTPLPREKIQQQIGIKDREHFRKAYLEPLLAIEWIERTVPDKPNSRLQKYRLTDKGRAVLQESPKEGI
ncbi:MAG: cell filamentation protein Fic, partial [Verrucomicrobia bacterium]|nr:cell filamentation protein Fic [Verrucomicrobiota bacterium]